MIKKSVRLITAVVMTFIIAAAQIPAIRVSAAAPEAPELIERAVFADRIAINVVNSASYPSGTVFDVYVSGRYIKTVAAESASVINLYDNGNYFKANKKYTINIKAVSGGETVGSTISVRTAKQTYYVIGKGTKLYRYSNGSMVYKTAVTAKTYFKGELVTGQGKAIAGQSVSSCRGEYVYIGDGTYKGYYAEVSSATRSSEITAKRNIVSQYGKSMNGGSYVWGAASYRRTDCSGLTLQCYAQIGVSLAHSVAAQARIGTAVSRNQMQPGDLIILNNKTHVAMYVGDGKMVHAMNSRDGIKVEPITKLQYYKIDTIRRIIA
jgi:cell wall-associated NlpC family hydrolase